jgi:hypothetical protein
MAKREIGDGEALLLGGALSLGASPVAIPAIESVEWLGEVWRVESAAPARNGDGSLTVWLSTTDLELKNDWGPAAVKLVDGSVIHARAAHARTVHLPGGTELMLLDWQWSDGEQVAGWVADLWAPDQLIGGNLDIDMPRGRWTSGHHLLQGKTHRWYLLRTRTGTAPWRVLIVGNVLERHWLWREFLALGFALGSAVTAREFTGLRADGRAVAAFACGSALHHREGMSDAAKFGPTFPPRGHDGSLAAMFDCALRRWATDNDEHMLRAFGGFRSACSTQMADVQYRELQVALEAFTKSITKDARTLMVKRAADWQAFVDAHEEQLRTLAAPGFEDTLFNKVRNHAIEAPSGSRVHRALAHYGLEIPEEFLVEVAGRNSSVHAYLLPNPIKGGRVDPWRRLVALHRILVVLVAKYIGFTGELADGPDPEIHLQFWRQHAEPREEPMYHATIIDAGP